MRWGSGAVLVSTGLVVLAGSGLVAIEQATVTSQDNSLTAGVITAEGGLAMARADDADDCETAAWSTGPVAALLLEHVDVGDPAWVHEGPTVCLRNDTAVALDLTATATQVSDVELGPCEPSEAAAGDASCGDGDDGELGAAVVLAWDLVLPTGSDPAATACRAASREFGDHVTDGAELGELQPGEICAFRLRATLDADEAVRARAQSDRLQWDLVMAGGVE